MWARRNGRGWGVEAKVEERFGEEEGERGREAGGKGRERPVSR